MGRKKTDACRKFGLVTSTIRRCQWPRSLRRGYVAAHILRVWVPFPLGAWTSVCCECCVLSGRGLCDELITRPGESYQLWCVVVCDLESSWMRRPWPTGGLSGQIKQKSTTRTIGENRNIIRAFGQNGPRIQQFGKLERSVVDAARWLTQKWPSADDSCSSHGNFCCTYILS